MPGCVLAGALAAILLYYREKTFAGKPLSLRAGLALLRGVSVAVLCFLLLGPILKMVDSEVRKPLAVILQDASQSAGAALGEEGRKSVNRQLADLSSAMAGDFEVVTLAFGSSVRTGPAETYEDKESDIEEAIRYTREVFDPQRLGAVILMTDGVYNRGGHPLYAPGAVQAPVYTVGLGNPEPVRDLAIKRLFHNKIAYKGDRFTVQLDLSAYNVAGERSELQISEITSGGTRVIEKQPVVIGDSPYFETREIVLEASQPGVRRFRFQLNALNGERNTGNNTRDMFIEVLDARQKILLVADAPHPDIGALQRSLAKGSNYQVDVRLTNEKGKPVQGYDLVIFHQVPSVRQNTTPLIQEWRQARVPAWFILGKHTDLQAFGAAQDLVRISGDGRNMNEVTAQTVPAFSLFTLSVELVRRLPQFPPLQAPFGTYQTSATARLLAQQRIGAVSTDFPLWVMGEEQGLKTGVLTGEGIWKWRLFDYLQHENHDLVDELVRKTVQYLALREDKRRFRVIPSKALFTENEVVVLDGELYNASYEKINTPDVQVVIRNEEGREFPYSMNKSRDGYHVRAGLFPPGNYTFTAAAKFNMENLTAEGRFTISPLDQELADIQADHDLLKLLAAESGGEMFTGPDGLTQAGARIMDNPRIKPVLHSAVRTRPLIDWRWLFAGLLALLGLEWFLRRYSGAY